MHHLIALGLFAFAVCERAVAPPPPSPPPELDRPDPAVVQQLCRGTCGGTLARVAVYRDHEGAIGRLVYEGDIRRCSHPPAIIAMPDGTQRAIVGTSPTSPADIARRRGTFDTELAGLTAVGSVSCPPAAPPRVP